MIQTDETAIQAAVARGQADVLASHVMPRPAVARMAGATIVADEAPPAERAVVWSHAARDVYVATMRSLALEDSVEARSVSTAIDRAAAQLGRAAVGAGGRLSFTYEKVVPGTSYVLAFEIVTWTKAAEVIAILHLFEASRDVGLETPL